MPLAQFQFEILPLSIQTGMFRNFPVQQSECDLWSTQSVEAEFHFLCSSSAYREYRNIMYRKVSKKYPLFYEYVMRNMWPNI